MCKDILYKPTAHQRHQWKFHKMQTPNAREAEKAGRDRYQSFDSYSGEIFHRMYSDNPQKIESPSEGTDVFQKLDHCIDEIPELADLKRRCEGDEHFSGIATAAIIDQIMKATPAPDSQVLDPASDKDAMEYLEQMLQESTDSEQSEAVKDTLEQMKSAFDDKVRADSAAADNMEASDIRNAMRKAAEVASEEIKAEQALVTSLSAGDQMSAGKTAQKQIAGKLRNIVKANPRMKEIAKLAGRLKRIAADKQRKKPHKGTGQIDGVELGNSIKHLLPSEMVYMDDSCEAIFGQKHAQNALLNWELKERNEKEKGAIVILLDSSYSMKQCGADVWAAAVAMAFLDIAKQQKRAFAIVHFGSKVLRVDSWNAKNDWSVESIIEAISFFAADGGTNFMDTIDKGLDVIHNDEHFKNADLVMVTDGCASISPTWLKAYKTSKDYLELNTYSILVGGAARLQKAKDICNLFSDESVSLSDALKSDEAMHNLFQKV